jgi:hypothetical protein
MTSFYTGASHPAVTAAILASNVLSLDPLMSEVQSRLGKTEISLFCAQVQKRIKGKHKQFQ